jgi:hypothetical protein
VPIRKRITGGSPALPAEAAHGVEVLVAAQKRKPVLEGEGGDPRVVGHTDDNASQGTAESVLSLSLEP